MDATLKTFVRYVSFNIMGMIGLSCCILTDTFFIARGVGADGLTALNLAIPVYSFMGGVGLMIGMGGATRYSISHGNGDTQSFRDIFSHGLYFALLSAVFFTILGVTAAEPLARLLGADSATLEMTKSYLQIILVFSPLYMCNHLLSCFVRNDGAPETSMAATVTGNLLNIVLDYIFVFPMKLGLSGAALATATAPLVGILILSTHIFRKKNQFHLHLVRPSWTRLRDICSLGVSSLISEVSSGVVIIVFNLLILKFSGNLGVAAYGIIANIALVLIAIFTGISQGIQPIISRSYGQNEYHGMKNIIRYAFITSIVLSCICYAIMFFGAAPITALFNKEHDPLLAEIAENGIHIYFSSLLFSGINIITASYLSSIERPKQAFILSSLRGYLLIIPAAFLLAFLFGLNGVWAALTVTELLVMFVGLLFIRRSFADFACR